MPHGIELTRGAVQDFNALDAETQRRIQPRIDALAYNPRPRGQVKKLSDGLYRIRIGQYRVVYSVDDAIQRIIITRVRNRRDAYRR